MDRVPSRLQASHDLVRHIGGIDDELDRALRVRLFGLRVGLDQRDGDHLTEARHFAPTHTAVLDDRRGRRVAAVPPIFTMSPCFAAELRAGPTMFGFGGGPTWSRTSLAVNGFPVAARARMAL
jgi:hypothetical protein